MGTAVSRGTKGVRERWREGGREGGRGGGRRLTLTHTGDACHPSWAVIDLTTSSPSRRRALRKVLVVAPGQSPAALLSCAVMGVGAEETRPRLTWFRMLHRRQAFTLQKGKGGQGARRGGVCVTTCMTQCMTQCMMQAWGGGWWWWL